MESINLTIQDVRAIALPIIKNAVEKSLESNKSQIHESISSYFERGLFTNRLSEFDKALDWAIENSFREGLQMAMDDLNFKELIYQKAKELLSNENFIKEIAEKKVKASLGL